MTTGCSSKERGGGRSRGCSVGPLRDEVIAYCGYSSLKPSSRIAGLRSASSEETDNECDREL